LGRGPFAGRSLPESTPRGQEAKSQVSDRSFAGRSRAVRGFHAKAPSRQAFQNRADAGRTRKNTQLRDRETDIADMDDLRRQLHREPQVGLDGRKEPDPAVDAIAYKVIGAAIEVHSHLGPGFLENAYEEALAIELRARAIPCVRQHPVTVHYKDFVVGEYRLDFIVDDLLVVELKAVAEISNVHRAQVRAYLAATRCELGLILNFNVARLRDNGIKRVVWTNPL
jgi:GxxExxY protein